MELAFGDGIGFASAWAPGCQQVVGVLLDPQKVSVFRRTRLGVRTVTGGVLVVVVWKGMYIC